MTIDSGKAQQQPANNPRQGRAEIQQQPADNAAAPGGRRQQADAEQDQRQQPAQHVHTPQAVNQAASREEPPQAILASTPKIAVLVPAAMASPENHTAMIYTSGPVLVNGATVARTTAIFPGDTLELPPEASATISAKGSSVTVAPGSLITYQGDAVALDNPSAVSISTTEDMAARVANLTIAPKSASNTKFQVVRLNGDVTVSVSSGLVEISDGASFRQTVAEGQTVTVPDPEPQNKRKRRRRVGGVLLPGGMSTAKATLIGLGAAGTAVGLAVATVPKPATPTHP